MDRLLVEFAEIMLEAIRSKRHALRFETATKGHAEDAAIDTDGASIDSGTTRVDSLHKRDSTTMFHAAKRAAEDLNV